jgi:uncharacterized protein (TIGR03382 family)
MMLKRGVVKGWLSVLTGGVAVSLLGGCVGFDDRSSSEQAAGTNPSADLDQCGNGPLTAPVPCTGAAWVNGNLNGNQAHYVENESVPYRMKFGNLSTSTSHAVTIEWDTTETGHHAEDYITTFNRTEITANPCSGIAGCNLATGSTFAIPVDSRVAVGADDAPGTADDIAQIAGALTMYGGTITSVSSYTLTGTYDGSSKTSIVIHFNASVANPVLAWGGHISLRTDWKPEPTASSIPGSPFHMRLIDLDGKGGNQDRSLASGAVFENPKLIVIKHVINDDGGTAVASNFTINVTGSSPSPSSFAGAESPGTEVSLTPGSYSVTEAAAAGYEASYSADCTGSLAYDETKTCTITNNDVNKCADVVCAPPEGECLQAGVCDQATGQCVYAPKAEGTSCSDDGNPCTVDACGATGQCEHGAGNTGVVCRASAGECDVAETCDGANPSCPADGFQQGNICRDSAGACDLPEVCSGTSASCPADSVSSGNICRPSAGACDVAEVCDGSSVACPADGFAAGNTCRPSAGACDVAEVCTGASASCPADGFSAGNTCRPSAGACDVAEVCSGSSASCPADGFSSGNTCRASAGVCDVAEVCSGSSASCPADGFSSGNTCRASAGVCDVAEVCSGSSASCPADGFSSGNTCRASAGDCDVAEVCSGSGASCPADGFASGNTCRESAGPCDVPETCSGSSASCPADGFAQGTTCRESAGDCDVAETCSGSSASCPADGFAQGTICRASAGDCDVAESCSGSSASCPADGFAQGGTVCRASAGACDVPESCTGANAACPADGFATVGTECRPSTGSCDPAEACTGTAAACPTDVAGTCSLCGSKFYDANANATKDSTESGIASWKITITDANGVAVTKTTDEHGAYNFDSLADGDYSVCEEYSTIGEWMQTAPFEVCYSVHVPLAHSGDCNYDFGNLCLGAGGGHTPGYWSNQNGRASFMGSDHGATSLALLVSLNLRNQDGSNFDPTSHAQFAAWLLDSTATNMAYKLSTHLAAMSLNVQVGFVSGSALVYAPGSTSANAQGFVTISALLTEANTELGLHPLTVDASPERTYQEALKNALDQANNNQNFVQSAACKFSFDPTASAAARLPDDMMNDPTTAVTVEEDNGGCSTGHGSSMWPAFALLALVVRRRRRR